MLSQDAKAEPQKVPDVAAPPPADKKDQPVALPQPVQEKPDEKKAEDVPKIVQTTPAEAPAQPPAPVKPPISQHAVECLRRLKGHRAPRGKRKVEFITDAAKRASTFSTLRQTIMRKLGELEVKCDAKILIAFHSHKKHVKTYAYGLNNWSSNKSNFDKVCQQTFYDRPCAPEGQDPLAEKARDELRSIYRSLMQRFCQGKNPGYGKPQKCPKWMPPELWIMVDKMKPDQLREAIRKVEDVIKEEHNAKVPRSTPAPTMRTGVLQGFNMGQNLMPPPRDTMHPSMVPTGGMNMGMHMQQRGIHMGGFKDNNSLPPPPIFNANMMQMNKHGNQNQQNFQMRPPVPPPHMVGQVNANQYNQGAGIAGQMTQVQNKQPQGGQQPRINLDDSEDNNQQQGMMQKQMPMPSPSLALSPNFQLKSPTTPGFNQKKISNDWEEQGGKQQDGSLQSHYSAFATPQNQMGYVQNVNQMQRGNQAGGAQSGQMYGRQGQGGQIHHNQMMQRNQGLRQGMQGLGGMQAQNRNTNGGPPQKKQKL